MKGTDSDRSDLHISHRHVPIGWISKLSLVGRDLLWLLAIHAGILAMLFGVASISVFAPFNDGDVRVFVALTVFLMPGWWLAPRFCPAGSGVDTRYVIAAVLSFVIHVWIAWPASRLGLSFDVYYVAFALCTLLAGWDRLKQIQHLGLPKYRVRGPQIALNTAVLFLICAAFRVPHSNDIGQFLMQQIDMAAQRSLRPSPIGMTAFGIDQPMPRWDTNAYHVWFSLLADVTRLPVEGIVKRWATVPMAVVSLLTLCLFVKQYAGKRVPDWVIVLAVFGPATIWFRTYSAYVYGMRVTNNFCLDKDFALFWLIPIWLWFLHRALRTNQRSAWAMLVLLVPLCIAIHPMTSIYLCMLVPFAVVAASPLNRIGLMRSLMGGGLAFAMFLYVFTSGGAQAYHTEIETIIHHDVTNILVTGQPNHHWIGHYAAVQNFGAELDTTQWTDGTLHLRPQLLWTGSALAALFLTAFVTGTVIAVDRNQRFLWRKIAAIGVAIAILLLLFAASGIVLTARPHLYRGIERLHWFAFLPAIVAVAICIFAIALWMKRFVSANTIGWIASLCLIAHLCEQGWHVARAKPTLLGHIPILHSVFDFYASDQPAKSLDELARFSINDGPVPTKPIYLTDNDHVLILSATKRTPYWELRQSVWWPELYGEANSLAIQGEAFLGDWQAYYDAVDWLTKPSVDAWIANKQVSVIVDSREGAESFVTQLAERLGRTVEKVADDTWRLQTSPVQ